MTHKEFFAWVEGYLHGRENGEFVDPKPIIKKMKEVKDVDPFFTNPRTIIPHKFEPIPVPHNPFKEDGYDDLGSPPKIVM
jgi:hypothetical protein